MYSILRWREFEGKKGMSTIVWERILGKNKWHVHHCFKSMNCNNFFAKQLNNFHKFKTHLLLEWVITHFGRFFSLLSFCYFQWKSLKSKISRWMCEHRERFGQICLKLLKGYGECIKKVILSLFWTFIHF